MNIIETLKKCYTDIKQRRNMNKAFNTMQAEFEKRWLNIRDEYEAYFKEQETRLEQIMGGPPELYTRHQPTARASMLDASGYQKSGGLDHRDVQSGWDMSREFDRKRPNWHPSVSDLMHAMCHPHRYQFTGIPGRTIAGNRADRILVDESRYIEFQDGDTPEECTFPDSDPQREEAIPAPDWPVRIPVEIER